LPRGDGTELALADLRGRIVGVLFSFDDEEEKVLRRVADRACSELQGDDFALVTVPLTSSATSSSGCGTSETVLLYGDLARKVGDAYGVLDTSAFFLVGPTGQILKSQGWDAP